MALERAILDIQNRTVRIADGPGRAVPLHMQASTLGVRAQADLLGD